MAGCQSTARSKRAAIIKAGPAELNTSAQQATSLKLTSPQRFEGKRKSRVSQDNKEQWDGLKDAEGETRLAKHQRVATEPPKPIKVNEALSGGASFMDAQVETSTFSSSRTHNRMSSLSQQAHRIGHAAPSPGRLNEMNEPASDQELSPAVIPPDPGEDSQQLYPKVVAEGGTLVENNGQDSGQRRSAHVVRQIPKILDRTGGSYLELQERIKLPDPWKKASVLDLLKVNVKFADDALELLREERRLLVLAFRGLLHNCEGPSPYSKNFAARMQSAVRDFEQLYFRRAVDILVIAGCETKESAEKLARSIMFHDEMFNQLQVDGRQS
ncbi:hypothetical protein FRC09_016656 [Ceratobasidium sp. 395]|nr:hypothetical protein FRC09_016656 [Ceratobasidium sp. 395]